MVHVMQSLPEKHMRRAWYLRPGGYGRMQLTNFRVDARGGRAEHPLVPPFPR
jgi:hypothetical protein